MNIMAIDEILSHKLEKKYKFNEQEKLILLK